MKQAGVLLDTHALIWYDSQPHRLPPSVRDILMRGDRDVFYSAITFYELWQKASRGSNEITVARVESVVNNLPSYGFKALPIHAHHSRLAASLEWENRDPFDRIIAAQAIVDGLQIVTADNAFSSLEQVRVVWE